MVTKPHDNEKSGRVRSLAKALKVVNLLADANKELSLSELSKRMDMPKSTTHGMLATLWEFGYVEQSPFTGNYKLGMRLFELGNIVAHSWDVRAVSAPYIQKLMDEVGETVHLVVLDRGEVVYIEKRECRQSIQIVSQIGMRLPAHCTGVGKVLLAYLPDAEVRQIIKKKGMTRFTKNTITDPRSLETELDRIRERGYAIDNEEIMDGLFCMAAPIRDYSGKVIAAVSVSGPTSRIKMEKLPKALELVVQTSGEISSALGYRPLLEAIEVGCRDKSI